MAEKSPTIRNDANGDVVSDVGDTSVSHCPPDQSTRGDPSSGNVGTVLMGGLAILIIFCAGAVEELGNLASKAESSIPNSLFATIVPAFIHAAGIGLLSIAVSKLSSIGRPSMDLTTLSLTGGCAVLLLLAAGAIKLISRLTSGLWRSSTGVLYLFGASWLPYGLYCLGVGVIATTVHRWCEYERLDSNSNKLDVTFLAIISSGFLASSVYVETVAGSWQELQVVQSSSAISFLTVTLLPLALYSVGCFLLSYLVLKYLRNLWLEDKEDCKGNEVGQVLWTVAVTVIGAAGAAKYLIKVGISFKMIDSGSFACALLSWIPLGLYSTGLSLIADRAVEWGERTTVAFTTVAGESSKNVSTLARLHSHLTFLPVIHLIRQHTIASVNGIHNLDGSTPQTGETHGNDGTDKEFLSRLELQRDSFTDVLIQNCILPWYEKISDDKTFPVRAKHVLLQFFDQLVNKIRKIDRTALAKEAIEVVHFHWTNYCEASTDQAGKPFRFVHTFIDNKEEVAKHYETLTTLLIKDLIVPDLQSQIICQFFASILSRSVVLYYVNLITNPNWINGAVKNLMNAGVLNAACPEITSLSHASSQESLADLPLKVEPQEVNDPLTCNTETVNGHCSEEGKSESLPSQPVELPSLKFFSLPTAPTFELNGSNGKNEATVTAALGGLLSAAALPLLPEGSSYDLSNLEALEASQKEIVSNNDKKGNGILSDFDQTTSTEGNTVDVKGYRGEKDNLAHAQTTCSRHFSVDSAKGKSPALADSDKGAHSLDESTTTCKMERQEQFKLMIKGGADSKEPYSKADVSPLYDEAEDFAATIAKLRSLLEQRESQKNLLKNDGAISNSDADADVFAQGPNQNDSLESDPIQNTQLQQSSTPNSRGSTSRGSTSGTNNRPSLNSQSSASSLGSDGSLASLNSHSGWDADNRLEKIVDELEETGPVLNRFFLNVAIPKTENCSDSSGQFVLYSIQYEGVYIEENDDEQLEKLVLRTTTIKRRFQEFLLLQNQLEESAVWRPHLKGIKAPNKWFSLSFAKSDTNNINQRKVILERYLQQLCYHPVLGFCPLLRQFMAYGEEGFQAFATSDEIPIHRFNKFTKKFTGVFNSLKDVLPSFESDLLTAPSTSPPDNAARSPAEMKARNLLALFLREEKLIESEPANLSGSNADSGVPPSAPVGEDNPNSEAASKSGKNEADSSESPSETVVDEGAMKEAYPLAVAMTNLLCDVLWLPHHRPHSASIATFLSISGKSFENYLQESLDMVLSPDAWIGHLEALATCLKTWGQEEETSSPDAPELDVVSEEELKQVLKAKIPVWIRWMWGRSRVDMTIERFTKVCQDMRVNEDLVLSLVELVFSKIIVVSVEREGI